MKDLDLLICCQNLSLSERLQGYLVGQLTSIDIRESKLIIDSRAKVRGRQVLEGSALLSVVG